MKPTNRRRKGKKFEEKVAQDLHNYFYEVDKEYKELFDTIKDDSLKPKRDFSSGTFSDSQGDIQLNLLKPYFPFSIECKHHANLDLSINSILKNDLKKLLNIWEKQVVPKAEETSLCPLLVFKANRTTVFAMCMVENIDLSNVGNYIYIQGKVIVSFEDFLNNFVIEGCKK